MSRTKTLLVILSMVLMAINISFIITVIKETDEMGKTIRQMDTSEYLMKVGVKDNRPYYLVDDLEEYQFRCTFIPIYGVSQGHTPDIPISGGTDADKQFIIDLVHYIPQPIKDYMNDKSYQIQIVSEITDVPGHKGTVIGHTDAKKRIIRVTMDEPYTIYHEIGHILNARCLKELESEEVTEELKTLCCHSADGAVYVYMNRTEQICESLFDYIWYPKEMQEQAPELYRIFNNYLDEEPYKMYTKVKD